VQKALKGADYPMDGKALSALAKRNRAGPGLEIGSGHEHDLAAQPTSCSELERLRRVRKGHLLRDRRHETSRGGTGSCAPPLWE
jgi:hypothetical protein